MRQSKRKRPLPARRLAWAALLVESLPDEETLRRFDWKKFEKGPAIVVVAKGRIARHVGELMRIVEHIAGARKIGS